MMDHTVSERPQPLKRLETFTPSEPKLYTFATAQIICLVRVRGVCK